MERLDYREGETFRLGGFPVTIAHARGGRLVAFVGSGECETAYHTERRAREYLENLDNAGRKEEDNRN